MLLKIDYHLQMLTITQKLYETIADQTKIILEMSNFHLKYVGQAILKRFFILIFKRNVVLLEARTLTSSKETT